MSTTTQEAMFWRQMKELRSKPQLPSLVEIADMAIASGMSESAALLEVQKFAERRRSSPEKRSGAAEEFVTTLCKSAGGTSVLEYTCSPSVLAAPLFVGRESSKNRLVIANAELTKVMSVLFGDEVILQKPGDIETESSFDWVICQPMVGYRPKNRNSDGFGGEVVCTLSQFVTDSGCLIWITARNILFSPKAKETMGALEDDGLHIIATIEIPTGGLHGSSTEGIAFVFQRRQLSKKLVGVLRDSEVVSSMATALLGGPSKRRGSCWDWTDVDSVRSYSDVEQLELLKKLAPRGRFKTVELGRLITSETINKASKPISDDSEETAFLFVPEYSGSQVTVDLEQQTVKPTAVYRLPIDTDRANPRFLATLLNGPYGRELRSSVATGTTISRISVQNLRKLRLPLPEITIQNSIAQVDTDLTLLGAGLHELRVGIERDWAKLAAVADRVNEVKVVLDVEQRIENWWRELPYPLATIYRRYRNSLDAKEKFDKLLHFFEMAAIYIAVLGTSHVRELRSDWMELFQQWLYPEGGPGIDKASFGFWSQLAGASLKELNRISSTPILRNAGLRIAGAELVNVASELGSLSKSVRILNEANRYRNNWKGHGGHLKESDAERRETELRELVRAFYGAAADVFRRVFLVRPGVAAVGHSTFTYEVQILKGSDPAFEVEKIELKRSAVSDTFSFWMKGAGVMCQASPFFRLGPPQEPQENCFYVYNRVESDGFRWVAYQEASQQEFVAYDAKLKDLIALLKMGNI